METVLNQPLFVRLQSLSLEPSEICLRVHTYGGSGCIHVSYRKILHASYDDLEGAEAMLAMLALKDSWISESTDQCPSKGNMNCFIEEFLMEAVLSDVSKRDTRLIQTRKLEKKFGRPVCWQGLINHYEITLSVVGGSWDGHTFEVYPGDNLIGKMPECEVHLPTETVSRRHATILLTETQIRIIDLGSLNGTFLNGILVNDAILAPDDELVVGEVLLKVRFSLRRPNMSQEGEGEFEAVAVSNGPRLADCKTINWKEFVPKKQQILSKIIDNFRKG